MPVSLRSQRPFSAFLAVKAFNRRGRQEKAAEFVELAQPSSSPPLNLILFPVRLLAPSWDEHLGKDWILVIVGVPKESYPGERRVALVLLDLVEDDRISPIVPDFDTTIDLLERYAGAERLREHLTHSDWQARIEADRVLQLIAAL